MTENTSSDEREMPQTIAEASRMLQHRDLSAVELVTSCLHRIEQVDGAVRACITVLSESALAAAHEADALLAQAPRTATPLTGIPLGIKDLIETRGVLTTAGSRVLDDYIPTRDATVVTRLRAAGAVLLAKTNTHEFAYGTYTPPTRNPWNLRRVPGGSSGGSAAGLAAGEFLGALGTDTGGSIRIPAGWCGVTGLKPTYGLVSRAGIVPLSDSLDHAGPLARTVEDCALLLDVLVGLDAQDPGSIEGPPLSYRAALADGRPPAEAVRGLRIGMPTNFFFEHCTPEVVAAVRVVAQQYADLGATLHDVEVPDNIDELFQVYRTIQRPEAYAYHEAQGWLATRADRYAPEVRANLESGAQYSAVDYIRAQHARQRFTAAMRAVFEQVDVLLTPTLPLPAPTVEESASPLLVDGHVLTGNGLRNTFPLDLTGQPALALPCGFTTDNLPISAQLVAAHFGEPTLLRLGHAYQRITGWHLRRPTTTPNR